MAIVRWLIKLGVFVFTNIVGHGILLWLRSQGYHPEEWVADVIGSSTTPEAIEAIRWILAGILGLCGVGCYEFYYWRRRMASGVVSEQKPVADQPQSITPNFAVKRRQIAETEIATLTADEQAALRQMLIIGRPKKLSDQIWQSLEMKTSFVERDFIGPKGIKNEFRPVLEEVLNKTNAATIISALRMTVGESGPYFDTGGGPYDIRRTFNLKLENIDGSKPVSNYSVKILSVTPATDYEGPWLLKEGLSLAAGDHVFIPLVTYGEAWDSNKYPCGDSFMTMGTAHGRLCLDVGKKYTVTMRATAPETAFCEFQCKIWVDDSGLLRIEGA